MAGGRAGHRCSAGRARWRATDRQYAERADGVQAAAPYGRSTRLSNHRRASMPTRVAINGFGRIGRSFVRSAYERGSDIEIVAINDIADPATLAHLFTYDSVYGQFGPEVTCDGSFIAFDGREIRV